MDRNSNRRFTHSTPRKIRPHPGITVTEIDLQSLLADLTSDDDARAVAAVDEISALGKVALPALIDLLAAPDPNRRWWAIRVLSAIPDPEVPCNLRKCAS